METVCDPMTNQAEERLLTRQELSLRWSCGLSTLKRFEKRGVLKPIVLGSKVVRYKLSDVVRTEQEGEEDRSDSAA